MVRNTGTANLLWQIAAGQTRPGRCLIEMCDVSRPGDIEVSRSSDLDLSLSLARGEDVGKDKGWDSLDGRRMEDTRGGEIIEMNRDRD